MSENIYEEHQISYGKKICINKIVGVVLSDKEINISNEHPTEELIKYLNKVHNINQNLKS